MLFRPCRCRQRESHSRDYGPLAGKDIGEARLQVGDFAMGWVTGGRHFFDRWAGYKYVSSAVGVRYNHGLITS